MLLGFGFVLLDVIFLADDVMVLNLICMIPRLAFIALSMDSMAFWLWG